MFFLIFILLLVYLWKSLLLPFMSLIRLKSAWALAFLTLSWHTSTVSLYTSWITCLSFYLFYTFLYFYLVKVSLFIHAGLLLPSLNYWFVRRTALLDLSSLHGLPTDKSFNMSKFALLNSEVMTLYFYLVYFPQDAELHYLAVTVAMAVSILTSPVGFSLFESNRPSTISLLFGSFSACIKRSSLKVCGFPWVRNLDYQS